MGAARAPAVRHALPGLGKLAALFERHRSYDTITAHRTARFLEWRYGPGSPNHSAKIHLVCDSRGNEGWFIVDDVVRGKTGQLRGALLVDFVWPDDRMPAKDLLGAIVHVCPRETHALFLRARLGSSYHRSSRFVISPSLRTPEPSSVLHPGERSLTAASLDLVPADGDSAFMTPGDERPYAASEAHVHR